MYQSFFLIFIYSIIYSNEIIIDIKPDTIYVGSIIEIKILIDKLNNKETPYFYDIPDINDQYKVVDKKIYENHAIYKIQVWKSGEITLLPIKVDINQYDTKKLELATDSILIYTHSNLNLDDYSLREIKPMRNISLNDNFKVYLILLFCGIIIIIYIFFKKNTYNNQNARTKFIKPNLNQAINSIEELNMPKNITHESTQIFYVKLGLIFRKYLNNQFYIKATKMTTSELTAYFQQIEMDNSIIKSWVSLSNKTDLLKYGKSLPSLEEYSKDKINYINLIKSFNSIK